MRTPLQLLTLLMVAVAGWLQRDQQAAIVYLLEHAGTDVIRLPHRSPNLNAYVERFVLSIKSECLERMIFFSDDSLGTVCHETPPKRSEPSVAAVRSLRPPRVSLGRRFLVSDLARA